MAGLSPTLRRPWAIFAGVTLTALAVRSVYIWQLADPTQNPLFVHPILDAALHRRWALGILDGTWPPPEPFFRAPLYPYFLALLYRIFGADNALVVQLAHGLVSALGAGLAGLCAYRIWRRAAGWWAGMGFALLWPSIFYAGELLDVTLGVTLNLLLWWLLLGKLSSRSLFAAGLTFGLSIICRPSVMVITPVVGWYLVRRGVRWRGRGGLLLAVGLAVAILPVAARNLLVGGEPVLVAASGGVNFFIGNNPYADGNMAFLPGAPVDWQGEMSEVRELAARESGRPQSALGADRHFLGKGLAFWTHDTGSALSLLGRKLWLLVAADERSNNKNLEFWRSHSPLLRWPIWLGWAPVLALALLGLWRRDTDPNHRRLMVGSLLLYAAGLLLFFINARFRLPLLAWLVVPAGAGADQLVRALRERSRDPQWWRNFALACTVLLVVWIPDLVNHRRDPGRDLESWRLMGDGYEKAGELDRARASYRRALDTYERYPYPQYRRIIPALHVRLGSILLGEGNPGGALPEYRAAEKLSGDLWAKFGVGMCLVQLGHWQEAEPIFREIVRRQPENWQAWGNLAICSEQTGRGEEAQELWRKVLSLNPGDAMARQRLQEMERAGSGR